VAGEGRRPAAAGGSATAAGAGRRDRGHRKGAGGAAFRPVAGADGHRGGQDLRGGDRVLPAAQARRVHPGAVPGRPQQPGRPDPGGVPQLPDPGRRARAWSRSGTR
jgi:hypothetical protein